MRGVPVVINHGRVHIKHMRGMTRWWGWPRRKYFRVKIIFEKIIFVLKLAFFDGPPLAKPYIYVKKWKSKILYIRVPKSLQIWDFCIFCIFLYFLYFLGFCNAQIPTTLFGT